MFRRVFFYFSLACIYSVHHKLCLTKLTLSQWTSFIIIVNGWFNVGYLSTYTYMVLGSRTLRESWFFLEDFALSAAYARRTSDVACFGLLLLPGACALWFTVFVWNQRNSTDHLDWPPWFLESSFLFTSYFSFLFARFTTTFISDNEFYLRPLPRYACKRPATILRDPSFAPVRQFRRASGTHLMWFCWFWTN